MDKANVSGIVEKVIKKTSGVASKVKGTTGNIAKATGDLAKTAHEKAVKLPEAFEKREKKEKPQKKAEPHVKLDDELRIAVDQYNDAYTMMNDAGATLYRERTRAVDIIVHVEELVNSIANRPKSFDTEVAEIQTQRQSFTEACEFAKAELDAAKKSALGAGAGVAAGAAIVSVAPTAAMWVATTFGTASTGTAISTLSGAAATNAALAWLGGGALTAGGGGMAGGTAFLAMAGPVGWSVAGVTLLSSIALFSVNKLKLDKKKKEEIEAVKNNTLIANETAAKIQELLDEVNALRDKLNQQYNSCLVSFGKDFHEIPMDQQMQLGALVNNTKALAASLGNSIQ